MHAGKSQGTKKRFIKRDHSKDDEPDVNKATPFSNQPPQLPHPPSLQAHGSPFHHSQSSTALSRHTPQEQQVYRRQATTPQQQRRQVMRSPSLNSPKTDRRPVVTSLSPLYSGEFRPSPVNFQAEVTSARAPRSPRPLKRANTERSSSSQPLTPNHFTNQADQRQVNRNQIREADSSAIHYDQIPSQAVNSHPQSHSEVYRRHSNEPLQSAPSRQLNRASVESDTSYNRLHAPVLSSSPPTEGLKPSSRNIMSVYNQQAMEKSEDYRHTPRQWTDPATIIWQDSNRFEHHHRPQVFRYPSRSPIHHKGPGFPLQISNCQRYPSPCNFSDGNKTRSSSLTDSIPGVQSPPSLVNTSAAEKVTYPFPQKPFQNQSFEARNSQIEHRPLCRSVAQLDSDKSRESSGRGCSPDVAPGGVFLRHKKERPDSNARNRRSFYDNDSLPDQSEQFEDSTQPEEMFSSPGNTWKSQTAPTSFAVFKRPVYGKIAQVVPPHLVGVFDPKKCLPLKRSNSKPTDYISKDQSFHEVGAPRNRASDSSFRYSDPVSHYGAQEGNFLDHTVRKANKTNDMPTDPKQLNQFLSLYSGPWSKETSLFGRANAAKETKKLETNWKKYEAYQDPYPSKVVAKGKTQKELDEHVELMERLKPQRVDPTEAAVHGETTQRITLSRSHESIDSSQETVPKPREHVLKSGSTKSRSQELPVHKMIPQEGNSNLGIQEGFQLDLSTPSNQRPFGPDKKAVKSQTPITCISVKQLTLSVPEQEIVILPSPENVSNGSSNMERTLQLLLENTESKLHTSRLNFLPSNSTSPRLMRKEMQASEWKQEDARSQRSSDPGMESSNSSKTEKYISCVTIPESELFRSEEDKQNASAEENTDVLSAAGYHHPQIQTTQSGKSRARRTKSDSTSINQLALPIEGDTKSAISEEFQKQQSFNPKSLSYFTLPDLSEEILTASTEIAKAKDPPSEHQLPSNNLANLCEDFLNDNFSFSDLQSPQTEPLPFDFKKPIQSSELSVSGGSSSSSLSLGESSFAAFCLQHQTDPTAKPATESDAKTPTNFDQTPLKDTKDPEIETSHLMPPSAAATSQSSAKKLQHSLSKQDSFNSPDSPLFHKTLPLPKDSVILHHRRHYLKECASFQSSSSSSEDSDLENFSALRLTPRRPRRNKQRSVV